MSEQNNNAGLGGSRNGGYDLKNRIQSDLDVNLLLRCSALDPRFKKLKFLNDKTDREDIFELHLFFFIRTFKKCPDLGVLSF